MSNVKAQIPNRIKKQISNFDIVEFGFDLTFEL
jgi:hypothetical protein